MPLTLAKSKQMFLLALILLSFGACKQSEFYDKSQLLDPAKSAGTNPGTDTGIDSTDNTNGGEGSIPPVVIIPPVENPPIATVPPIVNPPLVIDPVVIPPVMIDPPVATTPPTVGPPVASTPTKIDCSGSWGICSVTCGGGVQSYTVSVPASGGGNSCVATSGATQACNTQTCMSLTARSEIFTQDSTRNGDVDILWVIDDSGSMADNQDALARNFQNFITQFLDKKIDFKMAITTTDGTSTRNGKMVGDSGKLTRASATGNQAAFTNNFSKWVKVGTSGSGIEQGLKCASSFLDRYASSFLRSDAYLAIVFVSDENDQSDKKVSEYISRFQSTKANKGMVKAYSIVTEKLPQHAQWETIGSRYNEVSKATGGTMSDITDDFSATLKDIGGSIVNLVDRFALAESPYENKIQVFVNNVEAKSGWSFDALSRSLKFNADSVPSEGSKIEVRYKVNATVLGAI